MPIYPVIAAEIDQITRKKGPKMGLSACDDVRRRFLADIHALTGRNVIQYTSGSLHKSTDGTRSSINFEDTHGFMTTVSGMDYGKGLDLIVHSLGGSPDATAGIVRYLRSKFQDIRVVVPHLAMSAACMLTLGSNEVVMGSHSSLGPTDPQYNGTPAHVIIEEYDTIIQQCQKDPSLIPLLKGMLPASGPGVVPFLRAATVMTRDLTEQWLRDYMFVSDPDAAAKAARAATYFGTWQNFKSHGKHISRDEVRSNTDLKIVNLESDQAFQDAVLSAHHAACITMTKHDMVKIIENHNGVSYFAGA